jgi:hypothetical protein
MPDAPGQPLPTFTAPTPSAPPAVVAAFSAPSPVVPDQPTPGACFLTITGTLTSNGSSPVSFAALSRVLSENGRVKFADPEDGDTSVFWSTEDDKWLIEKSGIGSLFESADDVAYPWLAAFTATSPATGTPVLTLTGSLPEAMTPPPNTIAAP